MVFCSAKTKSGNSIQKLEPVGKRRIFPGLSWRLAGKTVFTVGHTLRGKSPKRKDSRRRESAGTLLRDPFNRKGERTPEKAGFPGRRQKEMNVFSFCLRVNFFASGNRFK
jgi:hypothetical protein